MRVVAGRLKGRKLETPTSNDIRPTTDRVRESVFNVLAHRFEDDVVKGARVLDLFAGTGANGIEALSRGASFALFVDNGAEARGLIRTNLMNLSLQGHSKLWRRDVTDMGRCAPMAPFDLAFLDPPYAKGLGEKALFSLVEGEWLKEGAIIIFEEEKAVEPLFPQGIERLDDRVYGTSRIHLLQKT